MISLNNQQKEAIYTTEGPVLILAGAGSGKTRVLTERIAYLLREKKTTPWNILAITFTNKAAQEMRERVSTLVGKIGDEIWISTFHSLGVRILRRESQHIGLKNSFVIYDTSDQLSLIKNVMKELNIDPNKYEPKSILTRISKIKNDLKTPENFWRIAADFFDKIVAKVYEHYQAKLEQLGALDFDDIIMKTIQLFQLNPTVLDYYQRKFHYIHVDEYQDTNRAQYLLVQMLSDFHHNICVVGDFDQAIYGWRGANIENILNFEQDFPQAKIIKLEQNYRSTKTIIAAANQLINHNQLRIEKVLWTENKEGEKISLYEADSEHGEAYFLVKEIEKYRQAGIPLNNIAILYRTNAQSRVLEDVFIKANIPYTIVGALQFYQRKEIKDIMAYLRLVANPDDDISFGRVVNVPKRGIGTTSLEKLQLYANENGLSLYQAVRNIDEINMQSKVKNSLISFANLILNLQKMSEYLSVSEITEKMLEMIRYREELLQENTEEAFSRIENINEFLSVTKEFELKSEDKSLINFLTEMALISDVDSLKGDEESKLTMLTIHSSKGLEFPIVFLVGAEEGIFPLSRALQEEKELEEERRLAYVAITRAKEKLFITYARERMLYGNRQANVRSRFIREIDQKLFKKEHEQNRVFFNNQNKREIGKSTSMSSNNQSNNTNNTNWQLGDKVEHKKWGVGRVIEIKGSGNDQELTVAFPAPIGLKRLLAQFAPLIKVIDKY